MSENNKQLIPTEQIMNRAMTKILTHTRMIINDLQTACGVHWTYHDELHLTTELASSTKLTKSKL